MHSGVILFLWLVVVLGLQMLDGIVLLGALLVLTAGAVALAPARSRRLVRRIRVLLLAIVVLFAGFTPGEAVWPDWPTLSPSREGLALALVHAGRLLAVVCMVAVLMEHLPAARLVAGLHALLSPLRALGLPVARVAVRIMLVLAYVEQAEPRNWRDWLQDRDDEQAPSVTIHREFMSWRDVLAVLLLLPAVVLIGYLW